MNKNEILNAILKKHPKIHCLTNPVTMNDVANILLAAGGSAVMAQDEQEAAEITTFCQGTLLNTGVPDEGKIRACILAGKRANQLGHRHPRSGRRRWKLLSSTGAEEASGAGSSIYSPLQSGRSRCTLFFPFRKRNSFFTRRCGKQSSYGLTKSGITRNESRPSLSLYLFYHGRNRYCFRRHTDSSSKRRRFQALQDYRRRMYAFCTLCPVLLQWCFCF